MKCDSCGSLVPESAVFCPECGVKLATSAVIEPADQAAGATEPAQPVQPAQPAADPATQPAQPVQPAAEPAQPAQPFNPYAQPAAPARPAAGATQPANPCAQPAVDPAQQPANPYAQQSSASNPYAQGQARVQPEEPYGAPVGSPYGAPAQQSYQAPHTQVVYPEGCISAALADIRASEGWFGKALLLGLINCVPVLNFIVSGYLLNWSREVPFGGRTHMPKKIFSGKNFEIGFYYFLISLAFGLVVGISSIILGWIPLLGWLAVLALSFGGSMFIALLALRMAMNQQVGEGFAVGKAWGMIKRNWTGLFCAALVPGIITGVIVFAIVFVVSLLGMGAMVPMALMDPYSYGSGAAAGMLGAFGVMGALVMLLIVVLCIVIEFFGMLVTIRAVAHWVGRYAPEWSAEAMRAAGGYGVPRY